MENVYNYVFHYNHINETWTAIPRDSYAEYWNDRKNKKFLRSSSIKTLIELIQKGEGFIKKIK